MSTESTGYHRRGWHMEPHSSSGQIFEGTSGAVQSMLDGSMIDFSSGASLRLKDGAVLGPSSGSTGGSFLHRDCQVITSTGGTITNHGMTVIDCGVTSDFVLTLASPVLGSQKKIVIDAGSSQLVHIINASSATYFNGSSDSKSIDSDSDVRAGSAWGNTIEMQATGTARWQITNIGSTVDVAFSTAIT